MHLNLTFFQSKNLKNFWGGSKAPSQTSPPVGRGTPTPQAGAFQERPGSFLESL